MVGQFHRLFVVPGIILLSLEFQASAQDTVRIRGTVERIEGPVFVVKKREGSEVKLAVTDNPLFVAIVPARMSDIKPGMFVGSAGMMQEDGTQKAIEVHIFPEFDAWHRRGPLRLGPFTQEQDDERKCRTRGHRRGWTGAVGQIQGWGEEAGCDTANRRGDLRNRQAGGDSTGY